MSPSTIDQKQLNNIIIKKSLLLWVIFSLVNAFFIALAWHTQERWLAVSLINLVIQIVILRKVIQVARDLQKGYWGRFFAGFLVSVVAGVGLIVTGLITYNWLYPNYTTELRDTNEQLLIESERSNQDIDRLVSVYDDPSIDVVLSVAWMLKTVGVGAILSLILAAINKNID